MEEEIDKEAQSVAVPPLLLQPLVENAVVHGIANLIEGGSIRLAIRRLPGRISILVENSFDPDAPPRRKSGVGLVNVRQRLAARYAGRATMDVSSEADRFRVAISLPDESKEAAA
ncbi:MAG: hypothetical protein WA879_03860 [Candidatus Acidiferrales bacterium]